MAGQRTTVSVFTADQWAQRLLTLYPDKWTGDAAKMAGGILYSLLNSPSSQFNFQGLGLTWVLNACRIATAEDVALDAIANDYFGTTINPYTPFVVRQPGEPDESFRQRIYANLLPGGGTREDIINLLVMLTGKTPRITEPWYVTDCASCDTISYCDIDTVPNSGRVMDLALALTGFVDTVLPSFGGNGSNPVYCVDAGLSCDRSFIIDPQPSWFIGEKEVYAAVNRARMAFTTVGVRFDYSTIADYARGVSRYIAADIHQFAISLFPPCSALPVALITPFWNTTAWSTYTNPGNVKAFFGVDSPPGSGFDAIIAPSTFPGYGFLNPSKEDLTASIAIPGSSSIILASPGWNTDLWLTSCVQGESQFEFSVPAPAGSSINYGSFPEENSGIEPVSAGGPGVFVTFPREYDDGYQLAVMPGWNTKFDITKLTTGFQVTFGTPPSGDSFIAWGVLHQIY